MNSQVDMPRSKTIAVTLRKNRDACLWRGLLLSIPYKFRFRFFARRSFIMCAPFFRPPIHQNVDGDVEVKVEFGFKAGKRANPGDDSREH